MDSLRIGILGGGQLGRMLVESANRLNLSVSILDAESAPAKQISAHNNHQVGSFKDPEAIRRLAKNCDLLTVEIEHVDTEVLEDLERTVQIEPNWKTIRVIQDKFLQKEHLRHNGVATATSVALSDVSEQSLKAVGDQLRYPFMLKSRTEAYDGRGNFAVMSEADISAAADALKGRPLYAEGWVPFQAELAVMVVKTKDGVLAYPVVETIHENSICKLVYAPARNLPDDVAEKAQNLAKKAIASLWGKGVFAVEMFYLQDGTLLVNEIAPRPHNSQHHTIEACPVSQFDAHLRAILDMPIPEESLELREPAIMLNVLGGQQPDSHLEIMKKAMSISRASIHLYGKGAGRPGRKMGHVTVTAPTMHEAEYIIQPLIAAVDSLRAGGAEDVESPATATLQQPPLVGVVMGSDSDLPVLKPGLELLESFGVPFEARITSAHRTPTFMAEYASSAASKGIKVLIAAAGGAAHLPGMAAAHTHLPVVGVPVKGSVMDGHDSLLSIVQMPRGVPVATVGINNSVNAALTALRILALERKWVERKLRAYIANAEQEVLQKDAKLHEIGWAQYLQDKAK